MSFDDDALNLRFCHEREVILRRRLFMMFKSTFLLKLNTMKLNGRCQNVLNQLYIFINANIDELFLDHMRWKKNLTKSEAKKF